MAAAAVVAAVYCGDCAGADAAAADDVAAAGADCWSVDDDDDVGTIVVVNLRYVDWE